MARAIYFLKVLLVFLLVACDKLSQHPDVQEIELVRYENMRFHFSVCIPARWTYTEPDNDDGIGMTAPEHPDVQITVYGSHNVWGIQDIDDLQRFHEKLDNRKGQFIRIRLGELQGIEHSDSEENGSVITRHRIFLGGDTIYGLYLQSPPQHLSWALGVFDKVSASFQITR